MLIGVLILKESSLHYLQQNVDFLSYIVGGTMHRDGQNARFSIYNAHYTNNAHYAHYAYYVHIYSILQYIIYKY